MTEQSLHNQLKAYYSEAGGQVEAVIDGYIIDVVRGDQLIEIQTGNFPSIKQKIHDLINEHRVRLVYPVPYKKWIKRVDLDDRKLSKRKSPKTGRVEEVFNELVYMPELMFKPSFSIEVPLVNVEETLVDDGKGSWRRRHWSIKDRELLSVEKTSLFETRFDLLRLLPQELPSAFTSRDITKYTGLRQRTAQRMAYCLRQLDLLEISGKKGRSNLYRILSYK
jgi:hypothetical protein